ncbi:MAG: ATP-binding cassette domain-containing protein [Gaiella sp.]|nr:ATP-binding cassette domain-containing protein [Gaiella sp.]
MRAAAAGRVTAWVAVAVGGALVAPAVDPLDTTLHPLPEALAVGCIAGVAAFLVLARRWVTASSLAAVPRPRLVARVVVLVAKSAQEETIWRALVLGLLVPAVGAAAALAVSTVCFAAAHVGLLGRRALAHLATGASFGLAYLATGRLVAAITAHATYNVLVGVTPVRRPDASVLDTGRRGARLVASVAPLARLRTMRQTTSPSPPLAVLEDVTKSFAAVKALDAVDLTLGSGEIVALLGPNGAGKSTAVAIMLGLRRPDAGRVQLCGRDPRDPFARRGVGAVLQDVGFPPGLRVRETVELVRAHFPSPASTAETLERLDLATAADRHAGGLSGGQRRRLAVALALAGRPQVLFLDEPTAGMDARARRRLLRDLAEFAVAGGTVLLTTQQLAEAEAIATRVVLLSAGRTLVEGTVAEVRAYGGLTKVSLRASALPPLAGVGSVESQGDRHVIYADDADALVATLVRSGIEFSELQVTPVSLEDAFVALTEAVE